MRRKKNKGIRAITSVISKWGRDGRLEPDLAKALQVNMKALQQALTTGDKRKAFAAVDKVARLLQREEHDRHKGKGK